MLEAAGYEVHDLGRDVPLPDFINKAKEINADVIALSTLMSTTMPALGQVVAMLEVEGIRKRVKVIVGGAPISPAFAKNWFRRLCPQCGCRRQIGQSPDGRKSDVRGSLDHTSIADMKAALPKKVIMGNINTHIFGTGSPEKIARLVRSCYRRGVEIITPACGYLQ